MNAFGFIHLDSGGGRCVINTRKEKGGGGGRDVIMQTETFTLPVRP